MPDTSRLVFHRLRPGRNTVPRGMNASLVDGYRVLKEPGYGCLYRNDREGEDDESRSEKDQDTPLNFAQCSAHVR